MDSETTTTHATARTTDTTGQSGTTAVGTPVWIDLDTLDAQRSREFYGSLFGWTFEPFGGDGSPYSMICSEGGYVGGMEDVSGAPGGEDGGQDGRSARERWNVFLHVDDIEARMERAVAAGATVLTEPGRAGSAGVARAVIDPSGAVVCLWEPGDIPGSAMTGRPGTPVWFELMTLDYDAAERFYADAFGFDLQRMPGDGMRYATNGAQEGATSGMCEANEWVPEEVGSYWRVYLGAEDCDAAVARVQELGGSLQDGPVDSPFGRLATVADPAGAAFQILQVPGSR